MNTKIFQNRIKQKLYRPGKSKFMSADGMKDLDEIEKFLEKQFKRDKKEEND